MADIKEILATLLTIDKTVKTTDERLTKLEEGQAAQLVMIKSLEASVKSLEDGQAAQLVMIKSLETSVKSLEEGQAAQFAMTKLLVEGQKRIEQQLQERPKRMERLEDKMEAWRNAQEEALRELTAATAKHEEKLRHV